MNTGGKTEARNVASSATGPLSLEVGEVLLRVGKPDHEAFIRNVRGQPEEKTWAYFPHPRDPQTLTIYTLRAGVVSSIERKIVR